ncbi:hypothetical protein ABG067_005282 [Albugo candida]|uniref:Non-structural maintenance of chromosomes element 1 homolog n=1 Tax=Albugo candida TaxID=65357 RepID=A0A024GH37_9STRA|nr:unnamed protein product [Albugo candida]|eukprot:CCI46074.1 unnamed protein product [Albugo candida]
MKLSDTEQMLLQILMAKGAISENELHKEVKKLADLDETALDNSIRRIESAIQPLALDLRRAMHDDGEVYFAIVNTGNDSLTKFACNYTDREISFFRKALEEIAQTREGVCRQEDMVDLRENTTIRETICLLDRLTSEKWLMSYVEEIEDDGIETMYSYGPRVFLELKDLVLELNISHCAICKAELVRGIITEESNFSLNVISAIQCFQ